MASLTRPASAPPGLPGGSIARGSIFSIFGTNLGPSAGVQVSAFPIQTTLGGVSVQVSQGSTTVAALPLYVGAGQVNALMPSNTPLGLVSVRVTFNNTKSNPSTVLVVNSSLGIFSVNGNGMGPGALQNYVSSSSQPLNSPRVAATPGQTIIAYATGLGPVGFPDNVAPTAGDLPVTVEVTVGGLPATVAYKGRTPCCSGLDQIVFTVPQGVPTGCWVPLYVRVNNVVVSNAVTMAISSNGQSCASDPLTSTSPKWGPRGNTHPL